MELTTTQDYHKLLDQISDTYTQGRIRAVQAVNAHVAQTYWKVGKQIVEFEQGGKKKAEYGKALITNLAKDLSLRHGFQSQQSCLYAAALPTLPNKSEAFSPIELVTLCIAAQDR